VPRRKPEVRREEILQATCDQVASRGFANTRAADVAAALGVSTALIFYHFDSKERLLSEALGFAAERDLTRLDSAARGPGTAQERLARILRLYAPVGSSPGWTLWIDAWAAALRNRELAAVSRRLDVRWKDTVAAVIAEGVAAGEVVCDDPSGAAWRITALLDGLAIQTTVHPGVLTRRQMNEWVQAAADAELGIR
jgi:AcrR family transcriptional regulator